ncbi:MAG: DEAD/DEAH box helicase [Flavobacteriales bacterium]|nr:DEAD/DEAH box helicase [Flavobacteriales bacterium]
MSGQNKNQQEILDKLGIKQLNPMQVEAHQAILSNAEVVLLSPTGTGKTLAFLLPIIAELNPNIVGVQALIVVPSRELATQIEQVVREMGSGYKTNAVFGGRSGSKDKVELKHAPAILIGTPGRLADHITRRTISSENIRTLVLDEFDKSLEVGFEEDMQDIVDALPKVKRKILTSATQKVEIPPFMRMENPKKLNYLKGAKSLLNLKTVISPDQDKLKTLDRLLGQLGNQSGIVFCNFKDTIQIVSDHLNKMKIGHACFYGGLEQIDRERALVKFRNGTHRVLLATDLAARGIDVPELNFIIHFELPPRKDEFIHRNGRTARMNADGTAYVIKWKEEELPVFIKSSDVEKLRAKRTPIETEWETLYISAGRKDKISKGDIAGLFFKQGQLQKNELGVIDLKQDYAFVAVPKSKAAQLISNLNNSRLKKRKVRISLLK